MINNKEDLVTNSTMPYRDMAFKEYVNKLKIGEMLRT